MKLLLKGHGVRIPFPETPGVKLRIVFFDTDEGRKQFRTNIIVLFGYRVDHADSSFSSKIGYKSKQHPIKSLLEALLCKVNKIM